MDAPTFRVGAEMWESLAPAAIWVGVDDTDVQRLGHVIPKPAIVDGTGDVAACGDLLGGNHHSTAAYFAGMPGLRYPTRVSLRADRHRLLDGVVNYVSASCCSMCPACGRCKWTARGIPRANSRECTGGVNGSAPLLTTTVCARTEPKVRYTS